MQYFASPIERIRKIAKEASDARPIWETVNDAEFDEDLHPRDEAGRFTSGGGGIGAAEMPVVREETWDPKEYQKNKDKIIAQALKQKEDAVKIENRMNKALDDGNREDFLKAFKDLKENGEDINSSSYEFFKSGPLTSFEEREKAREDKLKAEDRQAVKEEILRSLSPNELRDVYPYCKGRSDEELQGYYDTQDISAMGAGATDRQYQTMSLRGYAMKEGCQYDPVEKLNTPLSEKEIISKISFGDKEGYCASLAQAYLLNKAGYDVQDSKDDKSRYFFSSTSRFLKTYAHTEELMGSHTPSNVVNFLKEKVEPGKEYYFAVYRHAAVVRKNDAGKLQYLEAQSRKAESNDWVDITAGGLRSRFGYRRGDFTNARLIEGKQLTDNADYVRQAAYLNNPTNMKGGARSNVGVSPGITKSQYNQQLKEFEKQKNDAMKSAREEKAIQASNRDK